MALCVADFPSEKDKRLKLLSFPAGQGMILGFPLPTLVLTPGWAIFISVQKEFLCVTMK